tara:strand:+ start:22 stop:264 length:243 start_codon:yes stop_codon:yes gene_type:complete
LQIEIHISVIKRIVVEELKKQYVLYVSNDSTLQMVVDNTCERSNVLLPLPVFRLLPRASPQLRFAIKQPTSSTITTSTTT